ncbi:MAG: hypothetical protein HKP48_02120 [Winogradskyella sp.]|uniref:hypothetical protein n=1 Tax=Winogradskyella sp. TaxID=1883156 RepID=UPI0017FBDE62|nr:hypothetical protein [Winogradskyella sp.]MBT8245048.1 hypothetical protein [Winogradskyella sp.]NNK22110.1 hypothetical protein [Winogradskyella sp.]
MSNTASTHNYSISNSEKHINIDTVDINGESYFKISNSDQMRPFFMSIVSDSNHWMFLSSNGGVSAGRKNSEYALFPYYTDDKITESAEITGSKSIFWVDNKHLWEPFSIRQQGLYQTSRNLYKNVHGNKVIFEETNHDLKLTFRYEWNSSDVYGFVKKSSIINHGKSNVSVKLLDGLQNILPYGVPSDTQMRVSNLVDAYKRNQLEKEYGLGIYALSAIIVDKAEPSEALKANVVWSKGLEDVTYLVSSLQLDTFRKTGSVLEEDDVKAEKGAYFINSEIQLKGDSEKTWTIIANVNQDHVDVVALMHEIKTDDSIEDKLQNNIDLGTEKLIKLNASSDALQLTNDNRRDTRHFANTLFNIMRGGIFDDNYNIEKWDFKNYISKANKKVFAKNTEALNALPETFSLFHLKDLAYASTDKNFRRLCLEYMPLKFSRRHGDPSRPWNKFSINTRNEVDGSKVLDYEGNWRDIFQNWEALAHAYPEFVESMIHKFLNATTFDGYNPYRVTKDGFDWETIEPDDPWSYIGYWGDHQIIYLLKFLEFIEYHKPGKLASFFDKDLFVYANVPYRIKSYQDILKDPKDTIDFDENSEKQIQIKREQLGADGALLRDKNFFIYKVNFVEKILATVLAKVSNFVPEAGIWLNTQRPEWNDANNALVGNGVSMVTLNYLRRFLKFFNTIIQNSPQDTIEISEELKIFFDGVHLTLEKYQYVLANKISDKDRKVILDGLGQEGSEFRTNIYNNAFSGGKVVIKKEELSKFINVTLQYLEHSIVANVREDGMHHAYNLITITANNEVKISYLDEMLEGQVAALSSGYLSSNEALAALDSMKNSKIFRPDQYSFLLYPNKDLPRFMEKNTIPKVEVEQSDLLKTLINNGNKQVVTKDVNGDYHFNGNLNNANSLSDVLESLDTKYEGLINAEKEQVLQIYESVFNHKAFTGRSGTFYGYEGLGSIYWHMVSKLLVAVQESCLRAVQNNESDEIVGRLLEHYYEINEGIGVHKSPELYGAFPTDPYSHTPAGKGGQQPGMTGQVKEDILSRIGELGVFVKAGELTFNPCLLRKEEFLEVGKTFDYISVSGKSKSIQVSENSLAFTYCQVPVIYTIGEANSITINYVDGTREESDGLNLNTEVSEKIFTRNSEVESLSAHINPSILK